MSSDGITVLKLGGSQALGPYLHQWLALIVSAAGQTVVVPGGGPFADAVRLAQSHMGFDDATAHRLALIGMEQYGLALCSLQPRMVLANSLVDVRRALERDMVPVWDPVCMALAASELPASWQLTSDSLAAWFAGLIGAKRLVLIKRRHFATLAIPVADLVAQAVVDPMFPAFLSQSGARAWLAGPATTASPTAITLDMCPDADVLRPILISELLGTEL